MIKCSTDAHRYLEGKNFLLILTAVLLSLVVNTGPCSSNDCVPKGTANVIKAVALLMEEAVTAAYVNRITEAIRQSSDARANGPPSEDMIEALQSNSDLLKAISTKHLETIERTNELAAKNRGAP